MHLVIHVGLIKTGSTFLQQKVFPLLEPHVTFIRSNEKLLSRKHITKNQNSILISDENISGNPLDDGIAHGKFFEQFKYSLDNIIEIHKAPKLVIGFREPSDFIQSLYKQYIREQGVDTWDQFLEKNLDVLKEDLLFSKYILYAQKKIRKEQLFIYTMDDFKISTFSLVEKLTSFICDDKAQGQAIASKINFNSRSNPSIPLSLEKNTIRLNKIHSLMYNKLGFQINFRVGKYSFNSRNVSRELNQYILPKFISFHRKRDIKDLENIFKKDWSICKELILKHNNI